MLAKEIKPGAIVVYQDAPCLIEAVSVQSPSARGAQTLYKYRARNLISRQKVDITLRGSESLEEADFLRRPVKYIYSDATYHHFLDQTDYNEYALPHDAIAEQMQYVTEQIEGIQALIFNGQCVSIQVPWTVTLRIVECEPGVRGNSATSRSKPAKLETGLVVQVPEYLEPGEWIKVDTRTGQYLSRA